MPKQKSHKGLLKRIRITGKKKVAFHKANAGHLRSGKGGKKLMSLRRKSIAKTGDMRRLQKMLNIRLTPGDRPAAPAKAEKAAAASA
ncbi:MAG: 50S ribosomal protein L35 [Planctomycetota bacterium]|nr:50S ribosomal protein L35 [Planctomycetota bacterium]